MKSETHLKKQDRFNKREKIKMICKFLTIKPSFLNKRKTVNINI